MINALYGLFLLGVLALVVGCFVYLFVTRDKEDASQASDDESVFPDLDMAKIAEELRGSYCLSALERIFQHLGAMEAWGVVLELKLTRLGEEVQMVVTRNALELCESSLEPGDTDRFRRAVREAGLQPRTGYTEEQWRVDVMGEWPEIARIVRRIIRSRYDVEDHEELQVNVFR